MSTAEESAIKSDGIDMKLIDHQDQEKGGVGKKMTLADVRLEMERLEFRIIFDEEICSTHFSSSGVVVGLKSTCHWGSTSKTDMILVVHHIRDENLTYYQVEHDLQGLLDQPYFDEVGMGCPPQGAGRGRLIILTYLVDHQIDAAAIGRIVAPPNKEWCQVKFLAAQDGAGKSYFFREEPFYPQLRYYAGRMTGHPETIQQMQPPPIPFLIRWSTLICIFYLAFMFVINPDPFVFLHLLIGMSLLFLVAWLFQLRRRCLLKAKQNRQQ